MSARGPLPSAPAATAFRRAHLTPITGWLAAVLVAACGNGPADYLVASKTAPDTHHVALARLVRCDAAWCERLEIGATPNSTSPLATLPVKERVSEIAWTVDGKRAGFVVNGQQLRLYDADTLRPAGQVDLVARDTDPPTREARGVTFSENGAAVTFDDCPRDRSGCRPGIVALR